MTDDWRELQHAESLLDLRRFADAEARARHGLALEPDSASLHHLLARALMCQDDSASAVEHARAAVRLQPESAEHFHLLAATLVESGQGADAHPVALRAVQLAPDDWISHLTLAHVLTFGIRGREALSTAEGAAHRAITLAPNVPDTHTLFGIIRWRQDDYKTAESAFRHALTIDPANADAQRNLASLQMSGVDLAAGVSTLSRALSAHPQDRGMHSELGRVRGRLLGTATFWLVLGALVFGGFCLATDFLLRQRGFFGAVMLFAVGMHLVKVARRLPGATWTGLLPWRAMTGMRLRAWTDWCMNGLALLVWFMPRSIAVPAWFVLAPMAGVMAALLLLRVLINDSEPVPPTDEADRMAR